MWLHACSAPHSKRSTVSKNRWVHILTLQKPHTDVVTQRSGFSLALHTWIHQKLRARGRSVTPAPRFNLLMRGGNIAHTQICKKNSKPTFLTQTSSTSHPECCFWWSHHHIGHLWGNLLCSGDGRIIRNFIIKCLMWLRASTTRRKAENCKKYKCGIWVYQCYRAVCR